MNKKHKSPQPQSLLEVIHFLVLLWMLMAVFGRWLYYHFYHFLFSLAFVIYIPYTFTKIWRSSPKLIIDDIIYLCVDCSLLKGIVKTIYPSSTTNNIHIRQPPWGLSCGYNKRKREESIGLDLRFKFPSFPVPRLQQA